MPGRQEESGGTKSFEGPGLPENGGRVRKTATELRFDDGQRDELARLQTLGYLAGSRTPVTDQVITVYVPSQVSPGTNFYVSAHGPEAILMDMEGNELHRWNLPFQRAWPDVPLEQIPNFSRDYWRRAYLYENGDVLAIFEGFGLIKVDKESNLIWAKANGAHHDLDVMPNGDIYVLTRKTHMVPRIHAEKPVREDYLSVLDKQGNERTRISLLECAEQLFSEIGLKLTVNESGLFCDVLHTNAVEVLEGRAAHLSESFKAGNILLSMRTISALAVLDLEKKKLVSFLRTSVRELPKEHGPPQLFFKYQHEPIVLPGGEMLLFDNAGLENQSTIWQFNLLTREVSWYYRGTDENPFYSEVCGTAQRLPNGNTLITESDNGRAFEVTQDKEVVWEFYNPHRAGDDGKYIALVPELIRLPPDFSTDWAKGLRDNGSNVTAQ